MCGIAAILDFELDSVPNLHSMLRAMNRLQKHRGPDGDGLWVHPMQFVGFSHCRLSIIDIEGGSQPMRDEHGNWISYNGEIYNYKELREELGKELFRTNSDTEVILHAYAKWGKDCVNHLRGMFAFALWDDDRQRLFCARDRFGIKPLYYLKGDKHFFCSSEAKSLLPFVPDIETDLDGFADYLAFQFCLAGKTLFKGISELPPAHYLVVERGQLSIERYWDVSYLIDYDHTERYFINRLEHLLHDAVDLHLRADVPLGAYISGGVDSSVVASLASQKVGPGFRGFTGRFGIGPLYDESAYARELARSKGFHLSEIEICAADFAENIHKVIFHLDYPVAGPGAFPQYMVSGLARREVKAVLGGQGGDEIFGGYTRYLLAYFEQCIKAAINGTMKSGNFIVTYESIIPNLISLRNYQPLMQHFWRDGLFEDLDRRYFRLIDRAPGLGEEVNWKAVQRTYSPFDTFKSIFVSHNVGKESYFDRMTHFDFKTLLPALLHVEDRVSMAHGLESRVPFLDHPLIEFAATVPSNVKFKNGSLKYLLKRTMNETVPQSILSRQDKMGFPVPLKEWFGGELSDFLKDLLGSQRARSRDLINNQVVLDKLDRQPQFGRKVWGFLCLELWQKEFHDKQAAYKRLVEAECATI